jgi:tetratricopeptide (TPR) repeat protein
MFENEIATGAKKEAIELFHKAYQAQLEEDFEQAVKLYKRSIEVYPTAEAYTFLGWVYSFQQRYDEAIAECLAAISIDPDFGNPYNDIGSYLVAKGNFYDCVRWFKMAMKAPRYEARAYPYFNLARVYERRGNWLEAVKNYGLALREQSNYLDAYKALKRLQSKLN